MILYICCFQRFRTAAGLSRSTNWRRHSQFPNSAFIFYRQHTVSHTKNATAQYKITWDWDCLISCSSVLLFSTLFVIWIAQWQFARVSKFVQANWPCVHVLYVQMCMLVHMCEAVCFFHLWLPACPSVLEVPHQPNVTLVLDTLVFTVQTDSVPFRDVCP